MGWWVSTTRAIPAGGETVTEWAQLSQEPEAASLGVLLQAGPRAELYRSSDGAWINRSHCPAALQGLSVITTPSPTALSLCTRCLLASLLLTARLWCSSPGVEATSEELLPWDVGSCVPPSKTQGVEG